MFMIPDNHIFRGRERGVADSATAKLPLALRQQLEHFKYAAIVDFTVKARERTTATEPEAGGLKCDFIGN